MTKSYAFCILLLNTPINILYPFSIGILLRDKEICQFICSYILLDLLVLLDLLGYKDPSFISSFANTHKWYQQIMSAEQRLHTGGLLINHPRPYFFDFQLNLGVGDDHVPFMERDVPVLHVIPTPFPEVWHKLSDNYKNLDFDVIQNLINIFYIFTLEYLEGTTDLYPIIEEL